MIAASPVQGRLIIRLEETETKMKVERIPSIRLLAIRTTVNFIPRSPVDFLRWPISIASSASCFRSSSRISFSRTSKGDIGGGGSHKRKNKTNTEGINSTCFRIQIGAIIPSGYKGDDGVRGESGE